MRVRNRAAARARRRGAAGRAGVVLRAEVRRLPRDRVRRRRRARAPVARREGPHALLPGARASRRALRARRRDRDRRRRRRRRPSARSSSGSTPPRRGSSGSRASWPASYVAFDLLELDGAELLERAVRAPPRGARRARRRAPLGARPRSGRRASAGSSRPRASSPSASTPPTPPASARRWSRSSALRTIDCVVMGYRPGTDRRDRRLADPRALRARRRAAAGRPQLGVLGRRASASCSPSSPPYETGERGSGEPSRWSADRDLEWVALRPELVVEVSYDHVSDGRIRHGTKIVRWRDDKPPRECTIDQLR